ncbi:MAG TPA: ECF transporter S component [Clostridia bacterium]|nr:ECF transporter S component [Clostridia bacterium]
MTNNSRKIQFMTRTALLLALVVTVQLAGRLIPNSNFVVGPLVNACLLVSTAVAGVWSGIIISVVSPFASLINNHAPVAAALLPFAPFVAAGNAIYVLCFYLLKKKNIVAGIGIGAVLKFAFLYSAINIFLQIFQFPKFAKVLTALFGWPQFITALLGGLVALAVMKALKGSIVE